MARPIKKGLDYFPLDVGFFKDIKVRKIKNAQGSSAISVLLCLLALIYQNDGYYAGWDEDICFLVSDDVGVSERSVQEVVKKSLRVNFFNQEMYAKNNILTSKGIQNRFLSAVKERTEIEIIEDYWIGDLPQIDTKKKKQPEIIVIRRKNGVNPRKNEVNPPNSTQSKGKERKENNTPPTPPKGGRGKKPLYAEQEKEALNAIRQEYKFSKEVSVAINEWCQYKIERREKYQPTGFKNLLSQIRNNLKVYGDKVIINHLSTVMASGYKGPNFHLLKKEEPGTGKPNAKPYSNYNDLRNAK